MMVGSKSYDNIIISPSTSILGAMKKMDLVHRKLLLIFDEEKYIGLLSIGDLQRAIIDSIDINVPISKILRKDTIVAKPSDTIDEIKKMMLAIRAEFMPVVSQGGQLTNIYYWDELFSANEAVPVKQFDLPVVIMAGGYGTRLKPITNVLPKPLIPIGEKTMLEEIFDRFANHGCNRFFISVNYKADLIEFYIKNRNLPYIFDFFKEEKPMGTAGSLTLLKEKINSTFIVSNCDILIDQDYAEILDYHRLNNNEITVVAALKHYPIPYGILETGDNGLLVELKEKPELVFKINSGMYILEPHLLKEIPKEGFFHITELIESVKNREGKVGVFPISEKSWKDVGLLSEYIDILNNA